MKDKITEIKKIGDTITDKKSVYLEISPFPDIWTSGGNTYLNEMIELVGATNIFSDKEGSFSPSAESIIQKNPDVIITNVDYIENPIQEIKERDGWDSINAVKNDEVYQIDSSFSSRPNHNIVKALEQIAKAIYPDKYGK
jgi:iron complex transport system substrate-binding protein